MQTPVIPLLRYFLSVFVFQNKNRQNKILSRSFFHSFSSPNFIGRCKHNHLLLFKINACSLTAERKEYCSFD